MDAMLEGRDLTKQWLAMLAVALVRSDRGAVTPSTPVYLTLVCACGLLIAAAFQIAVWRHGIAVMTPVIGTFMAVGLVSVIIHMLSVKRLGGWSPFSQTAALEWLGQAPGCRAPCWPGWPQRSSTG